MKQIFLLLQMITLAHTPTIMMTANLFGRKMRFSTHHNTSTNKKGEKAFLINIQSIK